MSPEAFRRNLATLRRRNRRLAELLEAAGTAGVEVVEGPRGARTLRCDGVLLASAYDPVAEGERLGAEMAEPPTDLLVCIGFATGHHLEVFRARNPCPLVVFEPSPSRLGAALSLRPGLTLLGREDVRITTDLDELRLLVSALYVPGLRMRVHVHPTAYRLDPRAVADAVDAVGRTKDASDIQGATRVRMSERWARMTADNLGSLLASPGIGGLAGAFAGRPAVVAAAGPSLDKQLPALAAARDRVLVLAIGQTLGALRRAGIEPDLVHMVEARPVAHQLEKAGDVSNVTLVVPPNIHPDVLEVPVRARFIGYQAANPFGRWVGGALGERHFLASGGTVAACAVYLAAFLGANPVMLIGQDLAFTGGRVYASGSSYAGIDVKMEDGRFSYRNIEIKNHLFGDVINEGTYRTRRVVWVEGWDGEKVPTSGTYASFREHYRDMAARFASDGVRLINCTEGGAHLPGLEHLPFCEALAACPAGSLDAGAVLHEAHDAWTSPGSKGLAKALATARDQLDHLEQASRRGLERAEAAPAALRRARSPQEKIRVLRGLGKIEKRVSRSLERLPWLDSMVQREILAVAARARRSDREAADPEVSVRAARDLFAATAAAVEAGQGLLDAFEEALG